MKLIILTSSNTPIIKTIQKFNPISLIITNNPKLSKQKAPTTLIDNNDFKTREKYDLAIKKELDKINPDLILLADYNRIIKSPKLLKKYKDKIINIHLSYLPEFTGYQPEKQAFQTKAKESGFTYHIVNEKLDNGLILYQERIDIEDCKSPKEIKLRLIKSASKKINTIIANLKTP